MQKYPKLRTPSRPKRGEGTGVDRQLTQLAVKKTYVVFIASECEFQILTASKKRGPPPLEMAEAGYDFATVTHGTVRVRLILVRLFSRKELCTSPKTRTSYKAQSTRHKVKGTTHKV